VLALFLLGMKQTWLPIYVLNKLVLIGRDARGLTITQVFLLILFGVLVILSWKSSVASCSHKIVSATLYPRVSLTRTTQGVFPSRHRQDPRCARSSCRRCCRGGPSRRRWLEVEVTEDGRNGHLGGCGRIIVV
jgi:hypothetical protein